MKRTLILANFVLLGLVVLSAWLFAKRKDEAGTHANRVLQAHAPVPATPNGRPIPSPKPVSAQNYVADAVQKFLFSKDRNPNVIEKPAPPPPAPPPQPPLPAAYGIMMFGDPTLVLSTGKSGQHGYHMGDQVGEYKLVSFNPKNVTLEWNGQKIEKSMDELKARQVVEAAPAPPPRQRAAVAPPAKQGEPGTEAPGGYRACVPGDTSPNGTISPDGYKKVVTLTPMGPSCFWTKSSQ